MSKMRCRTNFPKSIQKKAEPLKGPAYPSLRKRQDIKGRETPWQEELMMSAYLKPPIIGLAALRNAPMNISA